MPIHADFLTFQLPVFDTRENKAHLHFSFQWLFYLTSHHLSSSLQLSRVRFVLRYFQTASLFSVSHRASWFPWHQNNKVMPICSLEISLPHLWCCLQTPALCVHISPVGSYSPLCWALRLDRRDQCVQQNLLPGN